MSKIIEKTFELLDELDNSETIKNLVISKNKLLNNKKALSLIEKYKISQEYNKLKIKKELYQINDYKLYMESYNELSMIVMKINKKFKEYTFQRKCLSKR